MPDVFSQAKRSEVMSRIRSSGNKDTEQKLAGLMRSAGITGWRRQMKLRVKGGSAEGSNCSETKRSRRKAEWQAEEPPSRLSTINSQPALAVRPDFVFRRERVAVFVDGCFWHGCPRHGTRPKQHRAFWDAKLARHKARDRAVTRGLKKAGWTVLRIWECALSVKRSSATVRRIEQALSPSR